MVDIWNCPTPDPQYDKHQAERLEWFNKIAPLGNWKNPIECWIAKEQFEDCNQAAIYFAGCSLAIKRKQGPSILVKAPGYYISVGS